METPLAKHRGNNHSSGWLCTQGCGYRPKSASARLLIRRDLDSDEKHCGNMLRGMWEDKVFTGFNIICGADTIPCHRAVLAQASPVFARMFAHGMEEAKTQRVEIKDVAPAFVSRALSRSSPRPQVVARSAHALRQDADNRRQTAATARRPRVEPRRLREAAVAAEAW